MQKSTLNHLAASLGLLLITSLFYLMSSNVKQRLTIDGYGLELAPEAMYEMMGQPRFYDRCPPFSRTTKLQSYCEFPVSNSPRFQIYERRLFAVQGLVLRRGSQILVRIGDQVSETRFLRKFRKIGDLRLELLETECVVRVQLKSSNEVLRVEIRNDLDESGFP